MAHVCSLRQLGRIPICLLQASEKEWAVLLKKVWMEQRSIEVFARLRMLDWRGPLLPWAQYENSQRPRVAGTSPVLHLDGLRRALQPDIDITVEHPHHTVLISPGPGLRRPRFKGKPQQHSDHRQFLFDNMEGIVQRNVNAATRAPCLFCYDRDMCFCRVMTKTGELVELREYGDKGVGVRCLSTIEKGDVVGEYVGLVEPPSFNETTVYSLAQGGPSKTVGAKGPVSTTVGVIQADTVGNWTRFINHSCEASCSFQSVAVGTEFVTVVMAERKILWGEEITVDYSPAYWQRVVVRVEVQNV